jgi:hypothetical protein
MSEGTGDLELESLPALLVMLNAVVIMKTWSFLPLPVVVPRCSVRRIVSVALAWREQEGVGAPGYLSTAVKVALYQLEAHRKVILCCTQTGVKQYAHSE